MILLAGSLKLERYTLAVREELESFYNRFQPKGAALGLPPRTPDGVHNWIQSLDKYPGLIMREAGKIVGHALLCPETYVGEVAVFVDEAHRGQGIGRRLLQAVIAIAVEMDLRRLWGITEPSNIPMLRLAASCGFHPEKEIGKFALDLTLSRHGNPGGGAFSSKT